MKDIKLELEQIDLAAQLTTLQRGMAIYLAYGEHDTEEAAYIAAGGQPGQCAGSAAREIMAIPAVDEFYNSLLGSRNRSRIMTRDEALERLSVIARGTAKDVAHFNKRCLGEDLNGREVWQSVWELKGSDELSDNAAALISDLTTTKDGFRFKTHNQMDAIKQIAAMEGWNYLGKKPGDKDSGKSLLNENLTDDELEAGIKLLLSAEV